MPIREDAIIADAEHKDILESLRHLTSSQPSEDWATCKYYWIPDEHHGFVPVKQIEVGSESHKVQLPDSTVVNDFPAGKLLPANSARYDRHEDMAELGELNEATILHCLKSRYQSGLIYTYSGLFLVAINPYKTLPIYTPQIIDWFKGQPRQDRPPHIFAVADAALADLNRFKQNQSILITGESGAGKTENTKKVIQYLATATGGQSGALEQKILSTNPILEAFGNAQTGKFVRIVFSAEGKIIGADIERYLLEKSRVTHRSPLERSFHIFYQLLSAPQPVLGTESTIANLDDLFLESNPQKYALLNMSNRSVDGIDDEADFGSLLESLTTIGLSENETRGIFKVISAILHLGNLQLISVNDQARITDEQSIDQLCNLLQVDKNDFQQALLNPTLKVGKETIVQSRDIEQVKYSIESLCRTIYERLFSWIVDRLNRSLFTSSGSSHPSLFIGVLDIAGFEIFEKNSFEQLCINYTNEKLQQFYNHHMFVQEQEEYKKEHVEWSFPDFGLDLQPTIDLLEKSNPVGIFACLDEDCIVPKATDRSFTEKIVAMWKGKSDRLEALRFGQGFTVEHYAGRVEYQTDGWLDKNKDPINDSLLRVLSNSLDAFISALTTSSDDPTKHSGGVGGGNIVKKGLFRTVAQRHRESLLLLMQQLSSTRPHFVRCILPNGEKTPGVMNANLVLEQLKCNGVFEGIRVCRNGYPGRVPVEEFSEIYRVLVPDLKLRDPRSVCSGILKGAGFKEEVDYRMGITKIFLKNGRVQLLHLH